MAEYLRLGVNIDHVATIRNARGGGHPDPVRAARQAGADGITAHLREDRRHISDRDIERLSAEIDLPLNLEMATTEEMLAIALRHAPHAACLVPEKRSEVTTEGGLDVAGQKAGVAAFTLLLSPRAFDFTRPVTVYANGRIAFEGRVVPSLATLLKWAAIDEDRTALYSAELSILPSV